MVLNIFVWKTSVHELAVGLVHSNYCCGSATSVSIDLYPMTLICMSCMHSTSCGSVLVRAFGFRFRFVLVRSQGPVVLRTLRYMPLRAN